MTEQVGLTHLYYGDGKGKTTAAFGLAFRCAGRGKPVVIAQFLKRGGSGELSAAARFPEMTVLTGKPTAKFTFQMNADERAATAIQCAELFDTAIALSQPARLLVLDEIIDACVKEFLPLDRLIAFLDSKSHRLEVVLTGHSLPLALFERADYISHIIKERHPYDRGIKARPEIEF